MFILIIFTSKIINILVILPSWLGVKKNFVVGIFNLFFSLSFFFFSICCIILLDFKRLHFFDSFFVDFFC